MPKPTKTALVKHPLAVILLAKPNEAKPSAADHDFEWFDTAEGQKIFTDECAVWATEDVKTNGDLMHLIAVVENTSADPITLGPVEVFCHDDHGEAAQQWRDQVMLDPRQLVSAARAVAKKATTTTAPKVKPKVKGRKPTAAAAVLKGNADDKAADLKEKLAAKKAPAKKAPAKSAAAKKAAATKKDDGGATEVSAFAMPVNRRAAVMARKRKQV